MAGPCGASEPSDAAPCCAAACCEAAAARPPPQQQRHERPWPLLQRPPHGQPGPCLECHGMPLDGGFGLVGTSLKFRDAGLEASFQAHAARRVAALDAAADAASVALNVLYIILVSDPEMTNALGAVLARGAALAAGHLLLVVGAPRLYVPHRVALVALIRLYKATVGSLRVDYRLPARGSLPLWLYGPGSGSVTNSLMLVPLPLHLVLQALMLAAMLPRLPAFCGGGGITPGLLAAAYRRVAALHARFGGSLLPGWLPSEPGAAPGGGGCVPLLAALLFAKTMLAASAIVVGVEASMRAAFAGCLPPRLRRRARLELAAAAAVNLAVGASLLPVAWEAAGAGARWAEARPSWVEAGAVATSLCMQLFMRYWLWLVLTLCVAQPLLRLQGAAARAPAPSPNGRAHAD